jgi:AraC-like DNA-binding protein
MMSSPGLQADPPAAADLAAATAQRLPFAMSYGSDGPPSTRLVCGYLACDAGPFNPLLENLPRVLKAGDPKDGDAGWLGQFIRFAVMESTQRRAGGESVLAKLSELMFIEVVRRHLETLMPEQAGWLAGLRDPFVGKALSLMHGKPAHDWTIEELATRAGQSRSLFAKRFTDLVGVPPMHYLAKWRMQIASERLGSGNGNVATIAADIGYESEAAFSRAFKKMMGVPPSDWRRGIRMDPADHT